MTGSGPRILAIMGSGETAPSMVPTHRRIVSAFPERPLVAVLDTPFGFQENADDLTGRTVHYLQHSLGVGTVVTSLRAGTDGDPAGTEAALADLDRADVVFSGPGSPSYALRHWRASRVAQVLERKLGRGGALVFASAAACTLGRRAIPVYEIYKVGHRPHWIDGLDLLRPLGLDAVVVPHFDNSEGGTHDTRFCWLGERRLRQLERELPPSTFVLGVDEHTAAVVDLDAGTVEVHGRGELTVRVRGASRAWPSGTALTTSELGAAARDLGAAPLGAAEPAEVTGRDDATADGRHLEEETRRLRVAFDEALERQDAIRAAAAALELERLLHERTAHVLAEEHPDLDAASSGIRSMLVLLGRLADAGLHDHRDVVAPYVDALLELRAEARTERRFELADEIRSRLEARGVEVHDTPRGTEWDYPA